MSIPLVGIGSNLNDSLQRLGTFLVGHGYEFAVCGRAAAWKSSSMIGAPPAAPVAYLILPDELLTALRNYRSALPPSTMNPSTDGR